MFKGVYCNKFNINYNTIIKTTTLFFQPIPVSINNYWPIGFTSFVNIPITSFTLNYAVKVTSYPCYHDRVVFYQWLAGFIDGDGHFSVSTSIYPRLYIEQEPKNLSVLLFIQSMIGGTVHQRARDGCYVYNLAVRSKMITLLNGVNGNIRNSIRVPQFHRACALVNITPLPIIPLTLKNAWFTGFYDADGNVTAYFTKTPFIVFQVTNKFSINLDSFMTFFHGNIYHSKSNDVYKWKIGSRKDVLFLYSYFLLYPSMSHKHNRMSLVLELYHLVDQRAYKETADPILKNQWETLKVN